MRLTNFQIIAFLLTLSLGTALTAALLSDRAEIQQPPSAVSAQPFSNEEHFTFLHASAEERFALMADPDTKPIPCTDETIAPLWPELMKDEHFHDNVGYSTDETADCTKAVDALNVDLNSDGKPEILLRGKIAPLCGGVGNCQFWVFRKRGRNFTLLLKGYDQVDRIELGKQILRTKTAGYSDLLLKSHFSAAETGFSFYKFNGNKYVESRCLFEIPKAWATDKPEWEFVTCKRFLGN